MTKRVFISILTLAVFSAVHASDAVSGKGAAMLPKYPSKSRIAVQGKKTGFFHVQQFGERWWVIDPEGNAFFIIGTDHVNYNVHWCEALGYAPYKKNNEKTYGGEEKWADNAVKRLKSWGFNALAANNSPSTRHKGLAHMEFLGIGADFSGVDCITDRTFWTGFPNVFSPKWAEFCDQKAKEQCAPYKDDPWLIGYFIDNELEWYGKTGSLFNDAFKRPADHTAKIALVELLKKRYKGDIGAFNKVWRTKYAAFDDLLAVTEPPLSSVPKAEDDVAAYAKLCAEKYFSVSTAAIRKHDPNHMILGTRFAGRSPGAWVAAGKYCDIVSVNCYRTLDLDKGVLTDGFEKDLADWHKLANRPMMITEWSFPGLDAGLPSVHGAGQRVKTQADRARAFYIFQKLLFTTPFIVGSDYFMWVDEPALGISKAFPEDSNYGLVNEKDEAYVPITEMAAKLHARAYDLHSGNIPDVYVKPSGKRSIFIVGNKGKAPAECKLTTWIDGTPTEQTLDLAGGASQKVDLLKGQSLAPGGHLLMCKIECDDSFAEPNPADNEAYDLFYIPEESTVRRVPLLVANLTDKDVENEILSVKLADLRLKFTRDVSMLGDTDIWLGVRVHEIVTSQVVPEDSLLFRAGFIGARKCMTYYAYPRVPEEIHTNSSVYYTPVGKGFEAYNGVLKLIKGDSGGYAFDKVEWRGTEVGSFTPLIFQQAGQNFWLKPDIIEDIHVNSGPIALVLDMTFRSDGGKESAITTVDGQGKPAEAVARPHSYRTKYRFVICQGESYFSSRCLWIQNTDTEPWRLQSYFHCPFSNIAGDSADDRPVQNHWFDEKTGLCYGVQAPAGFNISLWKDGAGAEHADVFRAPNLDRMLKPGEKISFDDLPVNIIAGTEQVFEEASRKLGNSSCLLVKIEPMSR